MPSMTIAPKEEVQIIPSIFDIFKLNRYQPSHRTLNEVKVIEGIGKNNGKPFTRVSFWFENDIFDPETGELVYETYGDRDYKMKTRVYGGILMQRKSKFYEPLVNYYRSLNGYVNLYCAIEGITENSSIGDDGKMKYGINANSISVISMFPLSVEVMQQLRDGASDTADQMTDPAPITAPSSSASYDDDQPF